MSPLETSFSAWLLFLSSLSVDTDVVLEEPASDPELRALEAAIGYELPDELIELYKLTNGQQDPYHVDAEEGRYSVSLFGHYDFLSVSDALDAYRFQQEIRNDYNSDLDDEIVARNGHFVDDVVWQEGWLPIAGSGANHIAVDLSPPPGGTYGQLIPIGADEFERFVLATSLNEFFTTAASETPDNECALEYGVPDTSDSHVPEEYRVNLNPYILYITAEWNHPFYQDNCAPEPQYEQPAYILESNAMLDRFRAWMVNKGITEARINQITGIASPELATLMERREYGNSANFLPEWFVPGGVIPQELLDSGEFPQEDFPGGIIPLDFQIPDVEPFSYFTTLGFRLACEKAVGKTGPDVLSLDEYRLFHRFLTVEGIWTEEDYQRAEQAMLELPQVESSGRYESGSYSCGSVPD